MFGPFKDVVFFNPTTGHSVGLSRLALCCETILCGFDDLASDSSILFRGVIRLQSLAQVSAVGRDLIRRQAARDGLALEFLNGGDHNKLLQPIDVTIQGTYARKYTFARTDRSLQSKRLLS